jgi:hypothetical protein
MSIKMNGLGRSFVVRLGRLPTRTSHLGYRFVGPFRLGVNGKVANCQSANRSGVVRATCGPRITLTFARLVTGLIAVAYISVLGAGLHEGDSTACNFLRNGRKRGAYLTFWFGTVWGCDRRDYVEVPFRR